MSQNKKSGSKDQQGSSIQNLLRERRWTAWAGGTVLALVLFLALTMGYATNWGMNVSRTAAFTPSDSTTPSTTAQDQGTAQPGSNTGSTANKSSGTTGTSGTTSSQDKSTSNTSTTTNNSSTTTTTNNTTSSTDPTSELLQVLKDATSGQDVQTVLNAAKASGLGVDCSNQLILVQTCKISSANGAAITIKSLQGGNTITGVTANF